MAHRQKRVVITGANKGIGLALVRSVLLASPETFVFLGSRSVERGEAAKQSLTAENPGWEQRIEVLPIDVADDASVTAAARLVAERFEGEPTPLYGLVNNAGIGLGSTDAKEVINVNTYGPRRVCEAFVGLVEPEQGRVVNISSASGPMFVSSAPAGLRGSLTHPDVTWEQVEALIEDYLSGEADGNAYGFSKACLNAYTMELARKHPELTINACTPGFIETDLTRPYAEAQGVDPKAMGMKPPEEGTRAPMNLLFGEPGGSGWYFGSDGERSPLDRYRAPGDPPYSGE
jgi:carbonyl reductase 1